MSRSNQLEAIKDHFLIDRLIVEEADALGLAVDLSEVKREADLKAKEIQEDIEKNRGRKESEKHKPKSEKPGGLQGGRKTEER